MSVDLTKGATVELVKRLSDDIRTQADGTKAGSAGAAVRKQITDLKNANALTDEVIRNGFINWNTFVQGARGVDTVVTELSTRCTTGIVFELHEGDTIAVSNIDSGLRFAVAGAASGQWVEDSGWKTADYSYTVAVGRSAKYFVNVSKTDNSDLSPSDISTLNVTITPKNLILATKTQVNEVQGAFEKV